MTQQRVFLVRSRLTPENFIELDAVATLIAFEAPAIVGMDRRLISTIANRRSMLVALGTGHIAGLAAAACLFSDFFAMSDDGRLRLDYRAAPEIAGALFWRIGERARRLLLSEPQDLGAQPCVSARIADALVASGEDSLKWVRHWIGRRSLVALASGAALIRSRRPQVSERVEFARLFASGVPQHGLEKFLKKQPAGFEAALRLEIV